MVCAHSIHKVKIIYIYTVVTEKNNMKTKKKRERKNDTHLQNVSAVLRVRDVMISNEQPVDWQ